MGERSVSGSAASTSAGSGRGGGRRCRMAEWRRRTSRTLRVAGVAVVTAVAARVEAPRVAVAQRVCALASLGSPRAIVACATSSVAQRLRRQDYLSSFATSLRRWGTVETAFHSTNTATRLSGWPTFV